MYRPEIKIMDVTIRDGGLMNDWKFSKEMVKEVFQGLARSGVDYIELGYRADKRQYSKADFGPWRFCDEEDLREVACEGDAKISIMCDVGRTDYDSFLPADQSIVSMVRVACYVKEIDEAVRLARHVKDLGYTVCVNMMAVSTTPEPELDAALDKLAPTGVDVVYLVDSFGYFYSEHVHYLAEKYLRKLPGKDVGIHTHNNRQLAFSNSIDAILSGINYVDASIYGMGRAAGNCTTELLLSFLKNPKYDLRPVLGLIEKYFEPLKEELKWGYELPYLVTGVLNRHPRTALAFIKEAGEKGGARSLVDFYDQHLGEA